MAVNPERPNLGHSPGRIRRRLTDAARAAWPRGAPGRILVALLVLGVALRILTIVSLWPTTIVEDGYQTYARTNPFLDPLHPAGYSLILGAIGAVTRNITATVVLQHLLGIASALLLGAGTRRVTGSAWAGLLPAAVVLLGGDEIFLEHSIMSESWSLFATSAGLYSAVRTLDQPAPWTRWPLLTGVALAIAVTIRNAGLVLIVVTVLALIAGVPAAHRRRGLRAPIAAAGAAAIVLLAFAGANATFGNRFGIEPSPGWYLYSRVAQFADCKRFTPPPGTAALCQSTPASRRPSAYFYEAVPQYSPALRLFGAFGNADSLVGGWAKRALLAQPGDFIAAGWAYFRSYFVPSSLPARLKGSSGLDPQLDFTNGGNIIFVAVGLESLKDFFDPFTVHHVDWGLHFLRHWQLVFRFGATALFVTTLLTLIGLAIGPRRSRVGVLLFGVGGISLLIVPALTSTYSGRYTVPLAGPLMAAAAITLTEIYRSLNAGRTTTPRGPRPSVVSDQTPEPSGAVLSVRPGEDA